MLNLRNIPNQMISGLSGDMLEFVSNESNERFVVELEKKFIDELRALDDIPAISNEDLLELNSLERS